MKARRRIPVSAYRHKIKTTIYLTTDQHSTLAAISKTTRVRIAQLIRTSIDKLLASECMRDQLDDARVLTMAQAHVGHSWPTIREMCGLPDDRLDRARQRLIDLGKLKG